MRIYTKTGDSGETALFGGGRVSKSHLRVAAYGEVDELNAALGVALATPPPDLTDQVLEAVQGDLFAIAAHLASPQPEKVAAALAKAHLAPEQVTALERAIDDAQRALPPLDAFVLPGGTPRAAALHLARTICRRAERRVVALAEQEPVPAVILSYVNRLSDLLFTLARAANAREGHRELTW